MIDYMNDTNLDKCYGIDVIYLDYRKTFDMVPHQRFLFKLSQEFLARSWHGLVNF